MCVCSELDDRSLTGTIPASLGSLSDLVILSLSGNFLTGQIPASLGSLSNLDDLYVRTIFFKYLSVGHV